MRQFFYALILAMLFYGCQTTDDQMIAICDAPKELSVAIASNTSVNISWTSDMTATEFVVEYGLPGFRPGSGTLLAATSSPFTLNGLLGNTTYDLYLRAFCGDSNLSLTSHMLNFTTKSDPVATDFMPTLSQMNMFAGDLADLNLSDRVFEYDINTILFTDYSYKQRIIALPENTTMAYVDDLLPDFPENTVIAKTFYFYNDERDESLGKKVVETRVLIKKDGSWQSGDYVWNASQTDAFLDPNGSILPISYIDTNGNTNAFDYAIPSNQDCITCHQNNGEQYPVGPKLRAMNFVINGTNQLEDFITNGYLTNAPSANQITAFPNWEDESKTLEERSRAYLDMNCAHCHQPGGYFDINNYSYMDLRFETSFEDSQIYFMRFNIKSRMQNYSPGYSMPYIGTTMKHNEGYNLIEAFIDSL